MFVSVPSFSLTPSCFIHEVRDYLRNKATHSELLLSNSVALHRSALYAKTLQREVVRLKDC